ncbi:hypothetical protein [Fusobacterium sp. SYSU M8D902]|uniref:hypothetical protein n=1 Tax=Fusobacterium sp. SYSU M8D902 TaxID=3159562 RepID=UPI0032E3E284
MKKITTILSVLALSSLAFGAHVASNQQLVDSPIGMTTKGDSVGAGVPFEVRVNVIPKGPELGIFDENGNLYDTIVFDHGTKLAGKLPRSVVKKTVILQRADGYAFSADKNGQVGSTTYTGKFAVDSTLYDESKNTLTLEKLSSSTDTDNTVKTMKTELNFIKGDRNVSATDNQLRTEFNSVILAGTEAVGGQYVGTGTIQATLTVK